MLSDILSTNVRDAVGVFVTSTAETMAPLQQGARTLVLKHYVFQSASELRAKTVHGHTRLLAKLRGAKPHVHRTNHVVPLKS